jgi:hypothetical protein
MATGKPASRFGIKEVADVTFYKINNDGTRGDAVLYLDTLKVSNIEFTAEQSEARGGKGNAPLIIWDYGREATVTLQDALLSMETLALMFEDNAAGGADNIIISANTFPGTYWVEGTTYARDEVTGEDDLFTFIIYKAKVQSEVTLTMEAEGDPTVFDINLRVLRNADGNMMELVKAPKGSKEMFTIAFRFANGETTTYRLESGDTITVPTNSSTEYEWNATPDAKATKTVSYYEVKKAG